MPNLEIRTGKREELVDITAQVQAVVDKSGLKDGFCLIYVPHTTAGVTINEGADPAVRSDIIMALDRVVRDSWPFRHAEGNSPAHVKASLIGSSALAPFKGGRLGLGTWQKIFFCEFDGPRTRRAEVRVWPEAPF
jgi:secondary thiamine-phosphate synthase enzyme